MPGPGDFKSMHRRKLPIVGVMGAGDSLHEDRSTLLGQWLATQQVHLLTGGGGGVMLAMSKAFSESSERTGLVIGVVPGQFDELAGNYRALPGYPNPWVEIPLYTHLPLSGIHGTSELSRNHINVLSSDVIVLLPGSAGTASEAELAFRYNKPVIAWLDDRSQIVNLNSAVPIAGSFEQIKEFINIHIR